MSGLIRTGVEIPVVLGQEINIVEDKTVPVREFHSLAVANIEEHRSVEHFIVVLRYHEYSIRYKKTLNEVEKKVMFS